MSLILLRCYENLSDLLWNFILENRRRTTPITTKIVPTKQKIKYGVALLIWKSCKEVIVSFHSFFLNLFLNDRMLPAYRTAENNQLIATNFFYAKNIVKS